MNPETRFKKSALRRAVILALGVNGTILGAGSVQAASEVCVGSTPTTPTSITTDRANFTMLQPTGATQGGTNDVAMTWDGTIYNASSDYTGPGSAANVTAFSTTPFSSHVWTAHDIQVFAPGSYSFDTIEGTTMNVTVPANHLGMHMLFDWNVTTNIDVFVVVAMDSMFGPGIARSSQATSAGGNNCDAGLVKNCLWDGKGWVGDSSANKPAGNKIWMMASVDGNGDGVMGIPMVDGPFAGFNANFNFPGTFSTQTLQNTCSGFVDTTPDDFSFTAVTNATANALYESNTITVSGLGATVNVSITGGEYSKNGGPYTNAAGTATNGDTFKVRGVAPASDGLTTSVNLTIGSAVRTFSISTPAVATAQGSNFTMLDNSGGVTGGTNDVQATWDGTSDTDVNSTNFSRMTLSSVTPFFSFKWTAHHIRVFGPGTYVINTDNDNESDTDSTAECTIAMLENGSCTPSATEAKNLTFTVGAGQIGAHMLFNWNTTRNIDVVIVWNQNQVFGPSQMYTGAGACNNPATVWDLMSSDVDGDGKNGRAMIDGPFKGFSANFNIRTRGTPLTCNEYVPSVNVDDPSGSKGCSISATPVNTLERGDWWLVAGFLVWLGAIRKRFARQSRS